MWTPEHRRAADRHGLRYPSDLSNAEWALVEPMIPPARRGGRKRSIDVREVLNAIFYVLSTGCQWKALPKDLPPKSTAHYYFMLWTGTAHWSASIMHSTSRCANRLDAKRAQRWQSSTARVAKPPKRGSALDPQGFDAGKKVTGRKRHILVDTLGLLLSVAVHPANIQDRDGIALVLSRAPAVCSPSSNAFLLTAATRAQSRLQPLLDRHLENRNRQTVDTAIGFEVVPKRWIVERTIAWISRFRRLARDFERYARTVAAFIRLAMVRIMLRRLTRSNLCS